VWLGAAEVGQALPPLFVWWRDFAALYVGSLCLHASSLEAGERVKLPSLPAPTAAKLSSLVLTAPIMQGAEYLTEEVLLALWDEMERAFAASLAAAKVGLQVFLTTLNPVCICGLLFGAVDLGAVDPGDLLALAVLPGPLPRSVLRCDLIHAAMAAELALVSSGMTIPLSREIFSANDICAGLAGLEPSSPGGPPSAFLRACWSRKVRQIVPDFV
jgi:hypothetical protein